MKTRSGIEMMTVGEIIDSLKQLNRDDVLRFRHEEEHFVLGSIQKEEKFTWYDSGKGVVIWKDTAGKEVFRIERKSSISNQLTASPTREDIMQQIVDNNERLIQLLADRE